MQFCISWTMCQQCKQMTSQSHSLLLFSKLLTQSHSSIAGWFHHISVTSVLERLCLDYSFYFISLITVVSEWNPTGRHKSKGLCGGKYWYECLILTRHRFHRSFFSCFIKWLVYGRTFLSLLIRNTTSLTLCLWWSSVSFFQNVRKREKVSKACIWRGQTGTYSMCFLMYSIVCKMSSLYSYESDSIWHAVSGRMQYVFELVLCWTSPVRICNETKIAFYL